MLPIEEVELEWKPLHLLHGEYAIFRNIEFKVVPVAGRNPNTGDARVEYYLSISFITFRQGYQQAIRIAEFGSFFRKPSAKAQASWWLKQFCDGVEGFTRESSCEKG